MTTTADLIEQIEFLNSENIRLIEALISIAEHGVDDPYGMKAIAEQVLESAK